MPHNFTNNGDIILCTTDGLLWNELRKIGCFTFGALKISQQLMQGRSYFRDFGNNSQDIIFEPKMTLKLMVTYDTHFTYIPIDTLEKIVKLSCSLVEKTIICKNYFFGSRFFRNPKKIRRVILRKIVISN